MGIFGLMPLFSLGLWPHVTRSWSVIHILKFLNYHLLLGSYCMYYVSFQIRMENNKDLMMSQSPIFLSKRKYIPQGESFSLCWLSCRLGRCTVVHLQISVTGRVQDVTLCLWSLWLCGDICLILRQRIDDLSDFPKYSWVGVRTERREPGKRGEPGVLSSHHCSVTLIVTLKL